MLLARKQKRSTDLAEIDVTRWRRNAEVVCLSPVGDTKKRGAALSSMACFLAYGSKEAECSIADVGLNRLF